MSSDTDGWANWKVPEGKIQKCNCQTGYTLDPRAAGQSATSTNKLYLENITCSNSRKLLNYLSFFYHRLMLAYTCSVQQVEAEGQRVAERAATTSDLPIYRHHPQLHRLPLSHREEGLETHFQNNRVLYKDFSSHGDSNTLKSVMDIFIHLGKSNLRGRAITL